MERLCSNLKKWLQVSTLALRLQFPAIIHLCVEQHWWQRRGNKALETVPLHQLQSPHRILTLAQKSEWLVPCEQRCVQAVNSPWIQGQVVPGLLLEPGPGSNSVLG